MSEKNFAVEEVTSLNEIGSSYESEKPVNTTHRGLKSRHIQLIALGGAIGTGLFVGSGAALSACGPAGIFTAYLIISVFVWIVMNELGEMVAYIPAAGECTTYALAERYTGNKSFSFACGLNLYYAQALIAPAEISAAAFVIQYWSDANVAIWISIFWVTLVALNFLAVKFFGEVEFWIASIKIFCVTGLIIVGIVIFFGGAPASNGVLGFHYWKHPGAFTEHLTSGNTGKFLAVISGIIKSAFAFVLSPELISSCAAESIAPRINVPKSTSRFIYRLIFFYVLGSLTVGVIVAYNDPRLMDAVATGASGAAASPFVIGIQNAGIKVLNHIVNACILTSAYSAGNSFIYCGSRTLYSMALKGDVPRIFTLCNNAGVPYTCVALSSAICLLAYLNISSSSATVFTWLSNISVVSGFISWACIGITYLRFRKAITYHGLDDRIPYRVRGQTYCAYVSIAFFTLMSLINGYAVFFDFNGSDFVAAYITLPIFFGLYFGHAIWTKNWRFYAPLEEIDCITGLAEAEKEQAEYVAPIPKNFLQRVWFWIA